MTAALGALTAATVVVGAWVCYLYFTHAAEVSLALQQEEAEQQAPADLHPPQTHVDAVGWPVETIVGAVVLAVSLGLLGWAFGAWRSGNNGSWAVIGRQSQPDHGGSNKDDRALSAEELQQIRYECAFKVISKLALDNINPSTALEPLLDLYKSAMNIELPEPSVGYGTIYLYGQNERYQTVRIQKDSLLLHVCATLCSRFKKLGILVIKDPEGDLSTNINHVNLDDGQREYHWVDLDDFLEKETYQWIRSEWLQTVLSSSSKVARESMFD